MTGDTLPAPTCIVCVPTFRRPRQLARLLDALGRQRGCEPFAIVVGNNDDRPLSMYPELARADLPGYRVIEVETRGVSAVRNALVADALAVDPAIRHIAFLDDDQFPEDDWLARLVDAADAYDADLAGGPVLRSVSLETFWSRGAADTSYLPTRDGPTQGLNEAGNLLLSVRFLRGLERPPFSLDYGRTGGEDYEFFLYARSRGARFAWASGARVHEPLPEDRLTLGGYAWRYFAIAAYQARADRSYHGARYVLRSIAATAVKAPAVLVRSLIRDRSFREAVGIVVQYGAMLVGRLVGLAGTRAEKYGREPA